MDAETTPRRRLSRAEAKARTRKLLLEAAAQIFARKGFAGASVEEIAETAGFSIGALYSNFANKEELFLELYSAFNQDRIAAAAEVLAEYEKGTEDGVNAMGRILVDADTDSDFALLLGEFWLYAARNPRVYDTMAARLREPRAALERLTGNALAELKAPPEATPQAVAAVIAALFDGLLRQRRLNPGLVSADLFGHAVRWLFAGIDATGARTPVKTARRSKKAN